MAEFTTNWLSDNKLKHWDRHLAHLKGKEDIRVLEIGSYEGRSAIWFANQIGHVTCVDPWLNEDVERRFDANTAGYRIHKIKGFSHEVLRTLPLHSFRVGYIDGDHDGKAVLEDAVHTYRLVEPDGIMIFDDVLWKNPNGWPCEMLPEKAVRMFLDLYRSRLQILVDSYQVIVRKL